MTGLEMTILYLFQEDHGKAVDLDAEHDDEEGERDVGDDGDEGVVADGDEHRQHEAEGAGAAHRVLPVHQVLHDGLGGGKVDHGGGVEEVAGGCCRTSWCAAAAQRLPRLASWSSCGRPRLASCPGVRPRLRCRGWTVGRWSATAAYIAYQDWARQGNSIDRGRAWR